MFHHERKSRKRAAVYSFEDHLTINLDRNSLSSLIMSFLICNSSSISLCHPLFRLYPASFSALLRLEHFRCVLLSFDFLRVVMLLRYLKLRPFPESS